MSLSVDRFQEGLGWEEWTERLGEDGRVWRDAYEKTALGEQRAEFQGVPTPRYVLCLFNPRDDGSRRLIPLIVRACEQAGRPGGVDLRLFDLAYARDLAMQYLSDGTHRLPLCVVFDEVWTQIGVWHPRPVDGRAEDDREILEGLLAALQGQPTPNWRNRKAGEHQRNQRERDREQRL